MASNSSERVSFLIRKGEVNKTTGQGKQTNEEENSNMVFTTQRESTNILRMNNDNEQDENISDRDTIYAFGILILFLMSFLFWIMLLPKLNQKIDSFCPTFLFDSSVYSIQREQRKLIVLKFILDNGEIRETFHQVQWIFVCKVNMIECKARVLAIIDENCDSFHVCQKPRQIECQIIKNDFNPSDPEQVRERWLQTFTHKTSFQNFSKNEKIMKVEL